VLSNLLGGIGVGSGAAVGGLVAESLGGTAVAGLGQATSVLGAAVIAVPLAAVATARGRRWALALGYLMATVGAALVIAAIVIAQLWLLLIGLGLFGVSSAANLQSRYAAAEYSSAATRGRSMSIVIWATTIGAVAGPNLTAPGDQIGVDLGLPHLAGVYLFSVVAFALGATVVAVLLPSGGEAAHQRAAVDKVGALTAMRWAMRHGQARFAVALIACAHAVMIVVMVMTPVHMQHNGMTLEVVGVVISLHVLGMYALSPVFGFLVDRWGAVPVAWSGLALLTLALTLGFVAGGGAGGSTLTAIALVVLGTGWSACLISGSAHLVTVADDGVRVPLQGATDAGMNYAGAAAAALAGPVLAWGGFEAVNVVGAILLLPAVACGVAAAGSGRPSHVPADNLSG
jgi:MFS family permease